MFASNLKPESATVVGVLTTVGVYLIYQNALPNVTDIRLTAPHNTDVDSARKHAAWESAALLGIVFLVSRDLNSYCISGLGLFGIDYLYKHNNAVHPATGKIDASTDTTIAPGMGEASYAPLPQYDTDDAVA